MATTVAYGNDIYPRVPADIWNENISEFARYLIRRGIHEHELTPYRLDVEYQVASDLYSITICVRDSCSQRHYHRFLVGAEHVRP